MIAETSKRYRVLFVGTEHERMLYEKSSVLKNNELDIIDIASNYSEILDKLKQTDFDIIFLESGISVSEHLELAGHFNAELTLSKTIVISEKAVTVEHSLNSIKGPQNDQSEKSEDLEKLRLALHNFLKSDIRERWELIDLSNKIDLNFADKKCFIVLKFLLTKNLIHDNTFELMESAFNRALEEKYPISEEGVEYISTLIDDSYVIMSQNYMVDDIVETISSLCEELETKYKIGISDSFDKMEYLSIAYKEALEAINKSKPEEKISNYAVETKQENDEIRHLAEFNTMIINALTSGLYDDIPNIVGMLFAELGNCDPDSAFNLCINSIKDILGYFSLDEIGKFKIKYRFDVLQCQEGDIYNFIKATYLVNIIRIRDMIRNIPSDPAEYIIKRVQDIVIHEYSKYDLSLSSVSQELSISYGYLSKIFKERTGTNFINYLTEIRMSNAKKLLLEGAPKIYEIANAVGYSSSGYFITSFRKFFGVCPGDYKARISGEAPQADESGSDEE